MKYFLILISVFILASCDPYWDPYTSHRLYCEYPGCSDYMQLTKCYRCGRYYCNYHHGWHGCGNTYDPYIGH